LLLASPLPLTGDSGRLLGCGGVCGPRSGSESGVVVLVTAASRLAFGGGRGRGGWWVVAGESGLDIYIEFGAKPANGAVWLLMGLGLPSPPWPRPSRQWWVVQFPD
jgi:hypothetical protein